MPALVPGVVVRVPLRKQSELAMVVQCAVKAEVGIDYHVREIEAVEEMPADPHHLLFIQRLAWYYQIEPTLLVTRFKNFLKQGGKKQGTEQVPEVNATQTVLLTHEQQIIVDAVVPAIYKGEYQPFVIHGVTGSGKTEVYKALANHALAAGKGVLFLVPEVRLSIYFEQLLHAQMPHATIFGFHSGKLKSEKKELWMALFSPNPMIIVGVHLPILLPMANLGLIIIDEEHDGGYQEKKHPKINTKEAALMRAAMASVPVVLGSATPSAQTLYNVEKKGWKLFTLQQRFSGVFARTTSVLLTDKKKRRSFWVSHELDLAIADRLAKKEQVIIFINRRGYSFFLQCCACAAIIRCKNCSVSLTVHEHERLSCHYCGYEMREPTVCISCHAGREHLLKKGIGTQQVVTRLQELYPQARIARADLDTSANKKEWQKTMADFAHGAIDIMVGTQTITKGYHFPRVTLVGIIWADMGLHVPFFNAAECALQQLIQVAGRAGRASSSSDVIVQAMEDHPFLSNLDERLYTTLIAQELERRQELGYPPYKRLVEIEFRSEQENAVIHESQQSAEHITHYCKKKGYDIILLGPARPPVHKVGNVYMRKIYLKGEQMSELIDAYRSVDRTTMRSKLYFTPHPQR